MELDGRTVPFSSLPVDYDPAASTATYCQWVTQPEGIDGAAASLTVNAILGGEQQSTVTLDLGSLELEPDPGTLSYALPIQEDLLAQAYAYRYETLVQDGSMKFLEPGEGKPISPGTDSLLLTGAAYVDERLHLQFRLPEYWKSGVYSTGGQCSDPDFVPGESYNTHPFNLPFTLKEGIITDVYDGPVEADNDGQTYHLRLGSEYLEIVDCIPQWALSSWTWDLVFITYETAVQGPWTQSFTLNSASTDVVEITEPFTVEVGTMYLPDEMGNDPDARYPSTYAPSTFDRVRVTPFAVTVSRPAWEEDQTPEIDGILKRFAPDTSKLEITVQTPDETLECTLDRKGYTVTPDEDGRMTARYLLSRPIDPQEVISLTVNGVEVPLS